MKRIIQMILLLILIATIVIFYNLYLKEESKTEIKKQISMNQKEVITNQTGDNINQEGNNLIKNLKYEITLNQNNDYIIKADLSEIVYKEDTEIIKMYKVEALLIDKNNNTILITSDEATYNNSNYFTNFKNNVEIKYADNIIFAENMILNFENNLISVTDNVKYIGSHGAMNADNIEMDLITKKISIFMNDINENVEITANN
jgi:lipopolysaccharide export system protein LptC